ncbi:MAG TPA: VOC family protein [Gammaproteobacteria bacterium]|nr:VOC family protein [Gammaproteobacteria bacterium]
MPLARSGFDIGLFTRRTEAQLRFWQDEVGLAYDHLGKLGGGIHQHRHHLHGAILKLNAARDPLPALPAGGYRALRIAVTDRPPRALRDPDGLAVALVAPGDEGTRSVDLMMAVSDVAAHVAFYRDALGLTADEDGTVRVGDARLRVAAVERIARSPDWRGPGLRYVTLQVTDARAALATALAAGAEAADPLRDLGDLVRYCFVRDPDGNFIELSERTTFTGQPLCP